MFKRRILLTAAGLTLLAAAPAHAQGSSTVQPLPLKGSITYIDTDGDGKYDAIWFDYDGDGDTEVAVYDVDRDGRFESDWVDSDADGVIEAAEVRIRARRPQGTRRSRLRRIRVDGRGRRIAPPRDRRSR